MRYGRIRLWRGLKRIASVWCRSPQWLKWGWILGKIVGVPAALLGRRPSWLVILSGSFGSLGDALLFSGALWEIRQVAGGKYIVLVGTERAYPVLARCPHVDDILTPPMCDDVWIRLVRIGQAVRVFSRRYDLVLCPGLVKGDDSEFMAYLSTARHRVLMESRSATLLPQNYGEEQSPPLDMTASQEPHQLDRTVLFMQAAGFDSVKTRKDIWPETWVTDEERAEAQKEIDELRRHVPGSLIVAICAGARFKQKDWGTANFIGLLRRLAQTRPVGVILIGADSDKLAADAIESGVGGDSCVCVLNKAGRTCLHASIALIEGADLCIGNDTFGLHAAIAVGTPSLVVMWGGDHERWAPWGDPTKHRMVRSRDQSCFGCRGKCVWPEYRCMSSIGVDDVMAEVNDLFSL